MNELLMKVKNLEVSFCTSQGEVNAVGGITFEVEKGETIAIVGESGCGKSVTAKSLMGLIELPGKISQNSKIYFDGENILDYTKKEWNRYRGKECAMIFQDALVALNPTKKLEHRLLNAYKTINYLKGIKLEKIWLSIF